MTGALVDRLERWMAEWFGDDLSAPGARWNAGIAVPVRRHWWQPWKPKVEWVSIEVSGGDVGTDDATSREKGD